ncbi:MAG: Hsp20/alpha crystallin family protein [Clostridiales bacterium]|jgi:HSP20 family protein|nr:Hsp20/alpha crystallin family protein [Clostridiales bacterium]
MHDSGWNPFAEFSRLRDQVRNTFPEDALVQFGGFPLNRLPVPSVDVHENEKEILISAEIPGIDPADLDVTVDETKVILRGEVKRAANLENKDYRTAERRYGGFTRTIPLPVEVTPDEAWAEYKNGVLEIRLNKSEHGRVRSRKLKINNTH